jgi:glycosyltransferase involved in cell wall biosynthesis
MNIAMFTDSYWPRVNGVTVSVDSFSHALIRAGHKVLIVCSLYPESSSIVRLSDTEQQTRQAEPLIIRVPSLPIILSKEDRLAKFHKWFWVSRQIEDFNPDVLHINSEFVIAEFGFHYAWLHSLPVVYTFHTLWEDYIANYIPLVPTFLLQYIAKKICKNVLRRAYYIIMPSPQIMDVVRRYKVKQKTFLLPTGIDPDFFHHDAEEIHRFRVIMEQKYPRLQGKRILLYAGRIAKEKNIDFLLKITPRVIEKHPETIFLLAGNGPDHYDYLEECERSGIGDYCVFSGYLDRQDLALTYGMSDIFVFPSLTETQGLVTIEAMLSGIPVVAIGAMGTLTVMNGDNGGFMTGNDPDEFVRRIFELLEDEDLYRRKIEDARRHAQAWTIDAMRVKLEEIYRDAISSFHKLSKKPV